VTDSNWTPIQEIPLPEHEEPMVPYAPEFVWRVSPRGGVWFGEASQYVVRSFAVDGNSGPAVSLQRTPAVITKNERLEALEAWRARIGQVAGKSGHSAGAIGAIPNTKPFFNVVVPTPAGGLWVFQFATSMETVAVDMFGPDGDFEGSGLLPDTLSLFYSPGFVGDMLIAVLKRTDGSEALALMRRSPVRGSA
jgi:hypothetical protein